MKQKKQVCKQCLKHGLSQGEMLKVRGGDDNGQEFPGATLPTK